MTIFKAYDIRGIFPTELDEKIAYLIGRAFATLFKGTVAVGGDARLSTPELKESIIRGLLDSGNDVVDIGTVPTPVVYFSCYNSGYDFGISITGSHTSKEMNGMKICDKTGIPIGYEQGLNEIENLIKEKKFREGAGRETQKIVVDEYIRFMSNLLPLSLSHMKLVIDGYDGVAGKVYSQVFRKLGSNVVELHCTPDGNFPNHPNPDPLKMGNIEDLEKKVKEEKADIGFAFDGDGDRLVVVDKNGSMVNSNYIFSLLIEDVLKGSKWKKVVHDVLCSKLIDDVIIANGGIPTVSRVGHTFIARRCFDEDAVLAGEVSGHYFFKETNYTDDVLIACLKLLKIVQNSGKSLSELANKYPSYYSFAERISVHPEKKFEFVENLKQDFKSKGFNLITLDGMRINFDNGWMLIRPSNTEAKISIGAESSNKEEFEKIRNMLDAIIKSIPR